MFIFIILIIILTIIALISFSPFKKSRFLIGIYVSFALMFTGDIIYIIKTGGYSFEIGEFLIVFDGLTKYITGYPITSNALCYMIELGRISFVFFVLMNVMHLAWGPRKLLRRNPWFYAVFSSPIIILLVLSYPSIYYDVFSHQYIWQNIFSIFTYVVLVAYSIVAIVIFVHEINDIRLSWYKSRMKNMLLVHVLLIFLYWTFAYVEPINIIQDYASIQLGLTYFYFSSRVKLFGWIIITVMGAVSILWASIEILKYVKMDYDKDKLEVLIKKKVSLATLGSTSLIHGIKNQILAAKLLSMKANKLLGQNDLKYNEQVSEALVCTQQLIEINQNMIDRMTLLYNSLKETNIRLQATDLHVLMDLVHKKVKRKTTFAKIDYDICDGILLCDKNYLSEAIYNLVINACDAVENRENPWVKVKVFNTRAHTVIKVEDNGKGIPKENINKIFMPFVSDKNSNNNWGMGLSYVQRTVKSHMGNVRVESQVNIGTKIYITLPRYDENENRRLFKGR